MNLPPGFVLDSGPAPAAGPVYGPPPKAPAPPSLAEMARVDISQASLDLDREKFDYQRQQDAQEQQGGVGGDAQARVKLITTIGKLGQIGSDANDNGGWFETGTSGRMMRGIGPAGTPAYDLEQNLKTVDARFAFDALQAMRDASKTGGALGAITEQELELLKSSVANLNANQSHEAFMSNLEEARQMYLSKLAMVDPQAAQRMGYNPENAEAAWVGANTRYMAEMGIEGGGELPVARTEPVAQQYPDDIAAIMQKYGSQ